MFDIEMMHGQWAIILNFIETKPKRWNRHMKALTVSFIFHFPFSILLLLINVIRLWLTICEYNIRSLERFDKKGFDWWKTTTFFHYVCFKCTVRHKFVNWMKPKHRQKTSWLWFRICEFVVCIWNFISINWSNFIHIYLYFWNSRSNFICEYWT